MWYVNISNPLYCISIVERFILTMWYVNVGESNISTEVPLVLY